MKNLLKRIFDPNDKKAFLVTAVLLFLFCVAVIIVRGNTYTCRIPNYKHFDDIDQYVITIDQDQPVIEVIDSSLHYDYLDVKVKAISPGSVYLNAKDPEGNNWIIHLFVFSPGVICRDTFFGDCTGDEIIPITMFIILAIMLIRLIRKYKNEYQEDPYHYRNIRDLGLIIFLSFFLIDQIGSVFHYYGLIDTIYSIINSASGFAIILLPIAFVVFVLVSLSNLQLMRKEGRNWRNMLGCILGILVCVGTLLPMIISDILQWRSDIIDVHDMQGAGLYIELFVENAVFLIIAYLECILLATIVSAIAAARHIPDYDKDYIMILGCQINEDGSLTPLLKGRADRAIEFAKMQKQNEGKDIVFVPSGGQGSDEVMPEGQAIRNYLISQGIPEEHIIVEDRSLNTKENFRYSMERINEKDPKIAFSTTNYHVFRAGAIASMQGIRAEGIGSTTKAYFWINAFIREYIATLFAERKTHLKIIGLLLMIVIAMIYIYYLANS
ncbi:MAG: YdcF family protein [Erysipelotrichaceae bacterium]|nr:YdcF family protein [Erysipelotrichaceae bacterium]